MELEFIEIDTNPIKPKATVHASGRLGFNIEAINFMELASKKNFKVAKSKTEDGELKNIYLIDMEGAGTAKVSKAGEYYYLNVGLLFEDLGLDFKNYTIIYDIKKGQYEGRDMYILKMRKPKQKKIKEEHQ